MAKKTSSLAAAAIALAAIVMAAATAAAQEPKKEGLLGPWKATAEVSFVITGGNTTTSAFSLGTSFTRKWTNDTLLLKTFILQSDSTTTSRTAQGTADDFVIEELKISRLVAENYMLAGQYDRRISKKLLAQAGLSWDRNRFAGVDDRATFTAGLGYAWAESKKTQVKTDAALTYTLRQYVGQEAESFAGFRFNLGIVQKILESSSVASQFIFDDNLKQMDDWRFDWLTSVTASISKSLALKTSLRVMYTHVPALQELPLFDPDGLPTGTTVFVPLKNLDSYFTTSLVINF